MTYGINSQSTVEELLVPKLKELRLDFNFPLNDEVLLGMIQSRWNPIEQHQSGYTKHFGDNAPVCSLDVPSY
jgi:hypothetical protein